MFNYNLSAAHTNTSQVYPSSMEYDKPKPISVRSIVPRSTGVSCNIAVAAGSEVFVGKTVW